MVEISHASVYVTAPLSTLDAQLQKLVYPLIFLEQSYDTKLGTFCKFDIAIFHIVVCLKINFMTNKQYL